MSKVWAILFACMCVSNKFLDQIFLSILSKVTKQKKRKEIVISETAWGIFRFSKGRLMIYKYYYHYYYFIIITIIINIIVACRDENDYILTGMS